MHEAIRAKKKKIDGILLLDKPSGITSNSILQKIKNLYRAQKAGHTGSLDPLATGMLPICLGEAAKFSQFLLNADKSYRVTAKLGIKTNTGDAEGEIIAQSTEIDFTTPQILKALQHFKGQIQQLPPMFSALKHQGQPLYALARQGKVVERKVRQITIYSIEFLEYLPTEHTVSFDVVCSKGTYIRTLVEDLGELLGCGAHVIGLHRLYVTPYQNSQTITLDKLKQIAAISPDELITQLLPVDAAVSNLPAVELNENDSLSLQQGRTVTTDLTDGEFVRLITSEQIFLGVGKVQGNSLMPYRLMAL